MHKVLIALLITLSLVSCESVQETGDATIDENRGLVILVQSERNALIATENEAFSSLEGLPLPGIFTLYSSSLPQFPSLLNDYLLATADTLNEALGEIVDWFFTHLDTMRIENVSSYFELGYSSFSDELQRTCYSQVYNIFLSHLEGDDGDMAATWYDLEREARIWRENLANLSLVGQGQDIPALEAFSMEEIALYATETFFTVLGENEVIQRGRMMGTL